jgi:pumilio RNA-binding family
MLPPASAGIPQYPNLNAGAIPFIPHPGQVNNPNSGVQTNITAGPPKQAPMPSLPPSVVVQPHGAHVPPLQPIAKQVVAPSENEKSPLKKHSSHPSALLAEFRARANNKWELADLKGHVLEFAKDQEGSRFIQRQMDTAPMEARHMVCDEVMPYSHDLTTDVFGNYVVQKSLEFGTEKQRQVIIACLKGSIMTLTLHTYGCRVVQRALEVADRASRLLIAQELKTDVIKCIHDQNGNHVLQKCIEVVPDAVGFIVEALRGNAKEIASHAYGCRVMQRLLEQCESTLKNDPLLDEILSHAKEIVRNQYGNYVVQHVLINAEPKYKTAVSDCILPDFFELACHKFASNVVEKVVLHSTDATRTHLADLWARSKCEDGSLWLVKMVTNQYGNYVVQRMFEVGNAAQRAKVGQALAEHIPHIKQYACARHIIPHIEANLPSNANISGNQGGNPPQRTRPANSAPYVQQSGGYSRGRDERGAYGSGPRRGGRGK